MSVFVIVFYNRTAQQTQTKIITAENAFRAGRRFYQLNHRGARKIETITKVPSLRLPTSDDESIQKFSCDNDHTFYLPAELPMDLMAFVKKLETIRCPMCDAKGNAINIYSQMYLATPDFESEGVK